MASRTKQFGKPFEDLAKLLLISLVVFVMLAHVPALFLDGRLWLESTFPTALLTTALLYFGLIAIRTFKKQATHDNGQTDVYASSIPKNEKVSRINIGIIGGLLGASVGGIISHMTASSLNEYPLYLLLVCGCLGGLGFGLLTKGNPKRRGLIASIFAVMAILFGLLLSYTAPVVVGYNLGPEGQQGTPIYLYNNLTFTQYISTTLLTLNGVFFIYLSFLVANLGAAHSLLNLSVVKKFRL